MADITAAMVKQLRETTGAGMMDSKKALVATDGDMDAAIEFLRKNGQAKAEKKANRIAAEGICHIAQENDETAVVVEVNSETVASPYIHQTGKLISELFAKAIQAAPSILIIDEIEAYLGKREGASDHHIEEVDEFLRNIPMAIEKQVLIIGMTNHLDMIDPAVLRKGRFDQILEVEMPKEKEVKDALFHLLENIPCSASLRVDDYAEKLTGHPLSDVAFLVREAARRTVRLKKEEIDDEVLSDVLLEICGKDEEKNHRPIGF